MNTHLLPDKYYSQYLNNGLFHHVGPYRSTAGDEGDKVGQERLRPDVAKWVVAGCIQDEENGFNAIGNGEPSVSFGMTMVVL